VSTKLVLTLLLLCSSKAFSQVKEYRVTSHASNSCPACPGGFTQIGCTYGYGGPNTSTGVLANQSRYFTTKGNAFDVQLSCSGGTIDPDCDYGSGENWYYGIYMNNTPTGTSVLGQSVGFGTYYLGLSLCRQN
jgi:hypothetical protein